MSNLLPLEVSTFKNLQTCFKQNYIIVQNIVWPNYTSKSKNLWYPGIYGPFILRLSGKNYICSSHCDNIIYI